MSPFMQQVWELCGESKSKHGSWEELENLVCGIKGRTSIRSACQPPTNLDVHKPKPIQPFPGTIDILSGQLP